MNRYIIVKSQPSCAKHLDRNLIFYAFLGCLWVLVLTQLLPLLRRDSSLLVSIQIAEDWGFAIATSSLLYIWWHWNKHEIAKSKQAESEQLQLLEKEQLARSTSVAVLEALRQSEERFRQLAENIREAFWIDSLNCEHVFYVSPAFEAMWGLTWESLQENPKAWLDSIHPEDRDRVAAVVENRAQDGYEQQYRLLRPDGSIRWIRDRAFPVRSELGEVYRFVGITEDITDSKRAEDALRESEQRFRQLAENINQVFWMTTPDMTQKLYVSPAYEKIWGKSCASLYEQPSSWIDIIHPEDRERVLTTIKTQHCEEIDQEFRIVHPDGSMRWIRDRAFPVRDEVGQVYRIVGIGEDITDRKQVEEEVRKALEKERELIMLKTRFVSMTSHEFRTPLTTIALSSGLLETYGAKWTQEKKQTHLQRIRNAVQRMAEMLDDVLLIGKAESDKVEFKPAPLELQKFCQEIMAEMQLATDKQHILTFVSHGQCLGSDAGELPLLDEKMLRHILTNLLSNAIKYSPKGGTIQWELTCNSSEAVFRIQDQGIGIPEEDQKRLFETFYRGTNVGNIPGTGLGLAIVKKFVELHGGEIMVNSQVDVGTTFIVKLPLKICY